MYNRLEMLQVSLVSYTTTSLILSYDCAMLRPKTDYTQL